MIHFSLKYCCQVEIGQWQVSYNPRCESWAALQTIIDALSIIIVNVFLRPNIFRLIYSEDVATVFKVVK